MRRVIVLGAGISGLTVAYQLKTAGVEVALLEATSRTGGWIQTIRQGDHLFELGPRSCRATGAGVATIELACQLGLERQLLPATRASHRRLVFMNNRLRPLSLLRGPYVTSLWKALWRERTISKTTCDDLSIEAFLSHRICSSQLANLYANLLTNGIYAGDPQKLSMRACFPRLWDLEQRYTSIVRGLRREKPICSPLMGGAALFSFRDGLEVLTSTLAKELADNLALNCPIRSLTLDRNQITVHGPHQSFTADYLFAAIPFREFMRLLNSTQPIEFDDKPSSVAVVSVGYPSSLKLPKGFGYLVAPDQDSDLLGVVWDSNIFPSQSPGTRLTAMLGGSHRPDLIDRSPEELLAITQANLYKQMGILRCPESWKIRIARQAIPQYFVGHHQRLTMLQQLLAQYPLSLLGSSYHGVSVNDCIAHATAAAREFIKSPDEHHNPPLAAS